MNREYPGNGLDARCRVTVSHLRPSRARPTSGSSRRYNNVLRFIPISHFIRPLYFPLVLPLVQTLYSNSRALFLSFSLLHFIVYTKLTRLVESSIDLLSSSSVSVCISKIHFTEQIARNYRQATTLSLSATATNSFYARTRRGCFPPRSIPTRDFFSTSLDIDKREHDVTVTYAIITDISSWRFFVRQYFVAEPIPSPPPPLPRLSFRACVFFFFFFTRPGVCPNWISTVLFRAWSFVTQQ